MRHASIAAFLGLVLSAGVGLAQQPAAPRHLADANDLVAHIDLRNTNYEHGAGRIEWGGTRESHADCSGFVDGLLSHSYGYDKEAYKKWFDSRRPSAARYHDAIADERGFDRVGRIAEAKPGDFLAVKYLTRKDNTGHIMLVAEPPQRMKPKRPFVEGTEQWQVTVIDSSQSGHGPSDTRHARGDDGKDHDGLGKGIVRLYAGRDGKVAGYTWSTLDKSAFKTPADEDLVIGRLKPDFRP